jgi:hypothetical protein
VSEHCRGFCGDSFVPGPLSQIAWQLCGVQAAASHFMSSGGADDTNMWSCDGTLDRIHNAFYVACREQAEREANPTIFAPRLNSAHALKTL